RFLQRGHQPTHQRPAHWARFWVASGRSLLHCRFFRHMAHLVPYSIPLGKVQGTPLLKWNEDKMPAAISGFRLKAHPLSRMEFKTTSSVLDKLGKLDLSARGFKRDHRVHISENVQPVHAPPCRVEGHFKVG